MKIIIGVALVAAAVVSVMVPAVGVFLGPWIFAAIPVFMAGVEMTVSGVMQELSFGEGTGFAVRGKAASRWSAD